MKRLFSVLLFALVTKFCFGQTQSIVGAWYWADSTKQTSMFFKQDGSISMHSGPKGGVILTKNLKNGTYVLTNNLLTIKWADNHIEKDKIKFIDNHSFKMTLVDKTNKKRKSDLVFRRVVDEEVIEENP